MTETDSEEVDGNTGIDERLFQQQTSETEETRNDLNSKQNADALLEARSKFLRSKSAAEGIENKMRTGVEDVKVLIDDSLEKALKAYRGELTGTKKWIYENVAKVGINLYEIETKRYVSNARKHLHKMKGNFDTLEKMISGEGNPDSLMETARRKEEVARSFAQNVYDNTQAIAAYNAEIIRKEEILRENKSTQLTEKDADAQADIAYLESEIRKLKDENRGMTISLKRSESKLKIHYQQWKTEEGKLAMAESVSAMNTEVYMNYMVGVEEIESLISAGNAGRSFSSIIKTAADTTQKSKVLIKMGNELGYAFNEAIDKVNSQTERIKNQSSNGQHYSNVVDLTKATSQVKNDLTVGRILKELLPSKLI